MPRGTLVLEGPHQALVGHHLVVDAVEGMLLTFGIALDDPPPSTGPRVQLVHRGLKVPWPPPLGDLLGIRVGLEHPLRRRRESVGEHHLLSSWLTFEPRLGLLHRSPPCAALAAGSGPVGCAAPPRSGCSAQSTRRHLAAGPSPAGRGATVPAGPVRPGQLAAAP